MPVEARRYITLFVNLVDYPVSVVLHTSCENDDLEVVLKFNKKFVQARSHQIVVLSLFQSRIRRF